VTQRGCPILPSRSWVYLCRWHTPIRSIFWCYHRSRPLSVKEMSCDISRSQGLRYFNIFGFMVNGSHELQRNKRSTRAEIRSTRVRLTRPGGRHLPGLSISDWASCFPDPSLADSRHGSNDTLVRPGDVEIFESYQLQPNYD